MTSKPLLLTVSDIEKFYKVDTRTATEVAGRIDPAGTFGAEPLYPRGKVNAEIKKQKEKERDID